MGAIYICNNCGKVLNPGVKKCPGCGYYLTFPNDTPTDTPRNVHILNGLVAIALGFELKESTVQSKR